MHQNSIKHKQNYMKLRELRQNTTPPGNNVHPNEVLQGSQQCTRRRQRWRLARLRATNCEVECLRLWRLESGSIMLTTMQIRDLGNEWERLRSRGNYKAKVKFKIIKLVEIKFMGIFNRRVKTGFCNFCGFYFSGSKEKGFKSNI